MSRRIYYYEEKVNGKYVMMIFMSDFRDKITDFWCLSNKILSDGKVTMVGQLDVSRSMYPEIFISEDAQWALINESNNVDIHLYVTENTREIITPLGDEWNQEFNRILEKSKQDYYEKKQKELRLYFYDASKGQLRLCFFGDSFTKDKYKYDLYRHGVGGCEIDQLCTKPDKDVFIIGRVVKTISRKKCSTYSTLMDFIEPVFKIELDFKKDESNLDEYEKNISNLEKMLYNLLIFTIQKQYYSLKIERIRAYLECKFEEPEFIANLFIIKIMDAFSSGDADRVRKLYKDLNKY